MAHGLLFSTLSYPLPVKNPELMKYDMGFIIIVVLE